MHGACGGYVQLAGLFEVINRLGIDTCVGAVGDDTGRIALVAIGAPALAARADHRRHRGVDDHVRRDVQVGDALVRVHHIHRRTRGEAGVNRRLDLSPIGHLGDFVEHRTQPAVRRHASRVKICAVLVEHGRKVLAHTVAKDDRVRDLHHRGFHVQRKQRAFLCNGCDLGVVKRLQRFDRHECRINDGAFRKAQTILQDRLRAVRCGVYDLGGASGLRGTQRDRGFVAAEIVRAHRGHARFALSGPFAHGMGVGLGECLNRSRGAAVRVAFAQNRIHRRAFDGVIAGAGVFFRVGLWVLGIVGDVIALRLKLFDAGFQLRHRGRDVGQLDHVRIGRFDQLTQTRKVIRNALLGCQVFGEGRNNPARQRNIAGFHVQAGFAKKAFDDRQQRSRGQLGGLIDLGVDNRSGCLSHRSVPPAGRHTIVYRPLNGTGRAVQDATRARGGMS